MGMGLHKILDTTEHFLVYYLVTYTAQINYITYKIGR